MIADTISVLAVQFEAGELTVGEYLQLVDTERYKSLPPRQADLQDAEGEAAGSVNPGSGLAP